MANFSFGTSGSLTGVGDFAGASARVTLTNIASFVTVTLRVTSTSGVVSNVVVTSSGTYNFPNSRAVSIIVSPTYNDNYPAGSIAGSAQILRPDGSELTGINFADSVNVTRNDNFPSDDLGTVSDDVLLGDDSTNRLLGLDGDDLLIGSLSADVMNGGTGTDTASYAQSNAGVSIELGASVSGGHAQGDQLISIENLTGSGFSDVLSGNSLANVLVGGADVDILTGAGGDDQLDGGSGADTLYGGSGNDMFVIDDVGDAAIEFSGEGIDTVLSSISLTLPANVENLQLQGGNLDGVGNILANDISGTSGNNRLDGGLGSDILRGGAGADTYIVNVSTDVIVEALNGGVDLVESSAVSFALSANVENLTLVDSAENGTGNDLANRIVGNSGNNVLDGAGGADTLQGGAGNDSYIVDNASDRVVETLSLTVGDTNDAGGVDSVFASVSYSLDTASNIRFVENLTLTGAANINATGNALANVITGNSGNNTLDGGAGLDTLAGGAGNDLYLLDSASETVTEGSGAGTDTVRIAASYSLSANVENLELQGSANINGIGNGEANNLTGTSGNNRLEGMGGNDVIDGGLGADTMLGGAGDDFYVIDNGNDRVFETITSIAADTNDAGGIDTVSTSITINMNGYNGIRFVERAVLTGTAGIGITGNALANHITGNSGNNAIDGGEGADTMIGGRGNDIYTVDNIGDVVTEVVGQGFDTVRSSIDYTLGSEIEDLVLTGSANLNGTGNGLANRLTGNAGNNILDGGGGTDTLIGGAGNDTYIFDNPGDRAFETVTATATDTNDAGGIDQILSPFSIYLAQTNGMRFIENATLTGTAAAAVYGNDLGNAITANSGANYLDGANGNDIILGMGGNDTMLGGAGADTLDGGAGRDRLTGGAGQDILTGGSEADTFVFATGDMGTSQATADRITDWSGLAGGQGDRIDLSAIDANTANGSGTNEAFTFIGSAAFSNVAGQLRSEVIGGNTYLMADTNGDGIADLWLQLDGTVNVGAGDLAL